MPSSAAPGTTEDKPLTRFAIADAVARVAPAVVNITVTMSTGDRWIFGPFSPPTTLAQSTGSGFIFDSKEGLVLTNAHVVTEMRNAPQTSEMTITLQDGRSFPGAVESVDALTDLAIVRILEAGTDLPAAELGRSSSLRTGEWVIAVGSPLMLANTVTCGIVSATNREGFEIGFPVGAPRLAFIQTDAAINIGNSGGPLVNLDGQVIGINTLKALSSDGISFALPIDLAKEVIHQLRQHGRVVRPFLGLKLLTLTPALAEELKRRSNTGFPADLSEGVCVPQVLPGGPADRGGLRAGDVVIAVDGKPVRTTRDILDQLGNRVGKPIEFTVIRGKRGQRITLQVTPEQAKS
jgi:HtrA serine peptidase 2